jgi:hypothetical protein
VIQKDNIKLLELMTAENPDIHIIDFLNFIEAVEDWC